MQKEYLRNIFHQKFPKVNIPRKNSIFRGANRRSYLNNLLDNIQLKDKAYEMFFEFFGRSFYKDIDLFFKLRNEDFLNRAKLAALHFYSD